MDFKMISVEILQQRLNSLIEETAIENINYEISFDNTIDKEEQLFSFVTNVRVLGQRKKEIGAVSVDCVFQIFDFDEVIRIRRNGTAEVNDELMELFGRVALSTTRGVMYSAFKGTLLHNAILPVLEPKAAELREMMSFA